MSISRAKGLNSYFFCGSSLSASFSLHPVELNHFVKEQSKGVFVVCMAWYFDSPDQWIV